MALILQDVIADVKFDIDDTFISSFMMDIIRGMAYLHSTKVHSHGNLKSSNCLVDTRLAVKVAPINGGYKLFVFHIGRSGANDIMFIYCLIGVSHTPDRETTPVAVSRIQVVRDREGGETYKQRARERERDRKRERYTERERETERDRERQRERQREKERDRERDRERERQRERD